MCQRRTLNEISLQFNKICDTSRNVTKLKPFTKLELQGDHIFRRLLAWFYLIVFVVMDWSLTPSLVHTYNTISVGLQVNQSQDGLRLKDTTVAVSNGRLEGRLCSYSSVSFPQERLVRRRFQFARAVLLRCTKE